MTAPNPSKPPSSGGMPPSVPPEHTMSTRETPTESAGCRFPQRDVRQVHAAPPSWPRVFPGL